MNSLPSNISKLIGQMIMVGIKGHDREAAYNFFERNHQYRITYFCVHVFRGYCILSGNLYDGMDK